MAKGLVSDFPVNVVVEHAWETKLESGALEKAFLISLSHCAAFLVG